jgi:hypothetical protein
MRQFFLVGCVVSGLAIAPAHAQIFGEPGTGRPTNTIVGGATGAALGAAIGSAGGEDGPWIGALVGSLLGGAMGNSVSVPTDPYYVERPVTVRRAAYCEPGWATRPLYRSPGYRSYRPRPVVVEEVIIEEPAPEPSAAPYGFMLPDGEIRSPHSDFKMSVGGLRPGQIVYDGLNGKPFMIP